MRRFFSAPRHWIGLVVLIGVVANVGSATENSPAAAVPVVPVIWRYHKAHFTYIGMTTLYVCDSLESQVKRILKYLGARADLKVTVSCTQPVLPTRQALVNVEFYSPAVADDTGSDAATGRWTAVGLESGHPNFIGAGDCDLIQDMKEMVTANFTLRRLDYSTSCFPNDLTLHDFGIKGEALEGPAPTRR